MTVRRKLIEVALPLEAINVASAREGSIYKGNPSAIHKWWAQRPLAACRAVLFASLVDDPSSDPNRFPTPKAVEDERTRLFGIIERLVLWENTTNETVLAEARAEIRRSTGGNPPPVLDPFCGGGSIPLEAQRLGLTVYASDLNPVAVLITKALVEIPPRFANMPPVHPEARRGVGATGAWKGAAGLADDVRRYGAWMRNEAERRIGHLYPKATLPTELGGGEATVIAWLWARTVPCPNPACGARMPLVQSFALSTKPGHGAWVEPVINPGARTVRFEVHTGVGGPLNPPKVRRGGSFRCLVCNQVAPEGHIRAEGLAGRMAAQLMAVATEGRRGRVFLSPPDAHGSQGGDVEPAWEPIGELSTNIRHSTPPTYGLTTFRDLFTPRQLVALTTFSDLVGEARDLIRRDAMAAGLAVERIGTNHGGRGADAYANSVGTYLAFALDKMLDYHCSLVSWYAGEERTSHLFTRQALPMVWDFVENNPFHDAGGSFSGSVSVVSAAVAPLPTTGAAVVRQADARLLEGTQALICSDPPYYDNVPYADLSDFFYVWLRRSLSGVYPDLFATLLTPKANEMVADSARFGGKSAAREHFENGLREAFDRIGRRALPAYPMTLYYAFKQSEGNRADDGLPTAATSTGWESMLEALLSAGLAINGTWPMRTERGARMRSLDSNALASSIVLVCRPRASDAGITTRRDFVAALKRELPDALRTLQHGNIAPVDLAQASIGPGMAVFSRYAKVLEPDGSPMRVRSALGLINAALDEILTEQEGEFDPDTRWAIAWYEQFGLDESDFGTAETLSKAKNTSVDGLVEAGILAASRGKVRLLAREEYSVDWNPATDTRVPVWEAMQRLIRTLLVDGETGVSELLTRLGGLGDAARDLAYRLYHVAERKGWTEEARAYNALVVAWPEIVRLAIGRPASGPAQTSLDLGG